MIRLNNTIGEVIYYSKTGRKAEKVRTTNQLDGSCEKEGGRVIRCPVRFCSTYMLIFTEKKRVPAPRELIVQWRTQRSKWKFMIQTVKGYNVNKFTR